MRTGERFRLSVHSKEIGVEADRLLEDRRRERPLVFLCPDCRYSVDVHDHEAHCDRCGWSTGADGVLDFVSASASQPEQAHYERVYADVGRHQQAASDLTELEAQWETAYYPMNRRVLERVGPVGGKRLLLLGNGTSTKELFLVTQEPELMIFSDLAPAAVNAVKKRFPLPEVRERVVFAAIDAERVPLVDASVDVVYAYAVVHHLPDVEAFLHEANRVLRPGGRAVFMDDAFSPIWQFAKRTFLRPLMRYFHALEPPSPEDLRFTLEGGFRETHLAAVIHDLGAEPWFERSTFLHYLVTRASERLPPRTLLASVREREKLLRRLVAVDDWLARASFVRRNQIRLVWGFDKPHA
jgi:ubiquinone/menaquinone biosynthesis C-methylase UbiE